MKFINKVRSALIGTLIAALLLPVLPVMAEEAVITTQADAPSEWALQDVQLTYLYQLASGNLFTDFQAAVTREELANAGAVLYQKLSGETADPASWESLLGANETNEATREDAAVVLYHAISESYPDLELRADSELNYEDLDGLSDEALQAARYFASHDIIRGKSAGQLNLSDLLSREQLLVLLNRTYEFVVQETNTASKGLIWRVDGGQSAVYLLGSVHIADISVYPLDNLLQEAFDQSTYLVVEANVLQDVDGIQYMAEKAVYSDGSSLDQHISAETYELLGEAMAQFGFGSDVYGTLKPWYAALLLQNLNLTESADYSANLGLDVYFISNAVISEKRILEIESIRFQVDLFESFSPELQEQFLLSSLTTGIDEVEPLDVAELQAELLTVMLDYWKAGDSESFRELIELVTEAEQSDEFSRAFWVERNLNMLEKVLEYLADPSGESYFVVVGAGHLYGEGGLIEGLEHAGFETEQLLD